MKPVRLYLWVMFQVLVTPYPNFILANLEVVQPITVYVSVFFIINIYI
jgi:hypothetical protein